MEFVQLGHHKDMYYGLTEFTMGTQRERIVPPTPAANEIGILSGRQEICPMMFLSELFAASWA